MVQRTLRRRVTFNWPFLLFGLLGQQQAGRYDIDTDEELIEGLSFAAWRRTTTSIRVPRSGVIESVVVDPDELDEALARDAEQHEAPAAIGWKNGAWSTEQAHRSVSAATWGHGIVPLEGRLPDWPDAWGGAMTMSIAVAPLFDLDVTAHPRQDIGPGPLGHRVIGRIKGGRFNGPRLSGDLLEGGGDWAIVRADGGFMIDVRATLRTDDGALIYMTYAGRWTIPGAIRDAVLDPARVDGVDPNSYYFRITPMFETGAADYAWLNDVVSIGFGQRTAAGVRYRVVHIL